MTGGGLTVKRLKIAVIGSGVSGLSAAWLLCAEHEVTLFEAAPRLGGHTNTVNAPGESGAWVPVDTGFIVYNPQNYPNFVALLDHLGVETRASDMSFSVSLQDGGLEYGSTDLRALLAQKRNLARPRFWSMLWDLRRFYRAAPQALRTCDDSLTLGDFLDQGGYGEAFQFDHLLPQAAAIWSCDSQDIRRYPFRSFARFFENHGLMELDVAARPQWRTVVGGSRSYLAPLTAGFQDRIRLGERVLSVRRLTPCGVTLRLCGGREETFDRVVVAAHAPDALALLEQPTPEEERLLGAVAYRRNQAVLHTDIDLMPRRRAAWSAWNYVSSGRRGGEVTYWMNRLQGLGGSTEYLVSLNPPQPPKAGTVLHEETYEHPVFDVAAIRAQREFWRLQGVGGVWYCGAYFGSGFHEDGLQAGLAAAEAIGGRRRPWSLPDPSSRIHVAEVGASGASGASAARAA